ncbi:UDP-glucuronosyltransferase [Aphelenchoides besseyi]|nr:UDP-glucuronosyltransferase [Aphelenchoides besseyi]
MMTVNPRLLCILFFFSTFTSTDTYKILTYCSQFGQSHVMFLGGISDVLAEVGHNVTLLQPELVSHIRPHKSKHTNVLIRSRDFELNQSYVLHQNDIWTAAFSPSDTMKQFQLWGELLSTSCYHMLRDDQLMNRLEAEKYDLLIGEHYDACTFGLIKRLGIRKHISAVAVPIYPSALTDLGHSMTTSYIPQFDSQHGGRMSYKQRVMNYVRSFFEPFIAEREFAIPLAKSVNRALNLSSDFNAYSLGPESSYFFVNSDEHLDFVQPLSPKIIHIGGLNIQKPKSLNQDFQQILDAAQEVVVVSFGTVASASHCPNETKAELVRFFSNFPNVTFIFKYETPNDGTLPSMVNVKLRQWIPQAALLANPKVTCFFSHGGQNSVTEAAQLGTPLLLLPLFGDQQKNAQMAKDRGIARIVQRHELNADFLTENLRLLIAPDSSYQHKARELAAMITEKPFGARDRVIGYVEHAIRFDIATNLDLQSRYLTAIQFYGLDILAPILLISCAIVWSSFKLLVASYRFVSTSKNKNKVE